MLGERAEIFFAADEFGFGAGAMLAFLGFLHGAADGGREALEFVFQDVIGGAATEALDGGVFADGAGNQDEGGVGILFADGVQGLQAVAGGQRIIGEDEVEPVFVEGGDEAL